MPPYASSYIWQIFNEQALSNGSDDSWSMSRKEIAYLVDVPQVLLLLRCVSITGWGEDQVSTKLANRVRLPTRLGRCQTRANESDGNIRTTWTAGPIRWIHALQKLFSAFVHNWWRRFTRICVYLPRDGGHQYHGPHEPLHPQRFQD